MNNLLQIFQEEYDKSILEQTKEIEGFENLDEENLEGWFQSDAYEPDMLEKNIVTNCVAKSNSDDSTDAEHVLNEGNTIYPSAALQSVETLLDYWDTDALITVTLLGFLG